MLKRRSSCHAQTTLAQNFLRSSALHIAGDFADARVNWAGRFEALSAIACKCLANAAATRPAAAQVATDLDVEASRLPATPDARPTGESGVRAGDHEAATAFFRLDGTAGAGSVYLPWSPE